jgi:hypothetical protein
MTYESFEEKYLGKDATLGNFLRETGKISYGAFVGMFRFPTTVRKSLNKQTRLQMEEFDGIGKILGTATGYVAGICADIYALRYISQEASQENYVPAIALGLTNVASFFYEAYRASKMEKKLERMHS